MAALTNAQLALIRMDLGDRCDDFSEAQLQAAYDSAEGDECGTRAILWRSIWMSTKTTTLNLVNGGQVISFSAIKAAKDRFDYWNNCWDDGVSTLSVGVIGLGIDVTQDDIDNPSAHWLDW